MTQTALLPDRRVIELAGEDRVPFLQGLVSNDVTQAAPGRAVWTALLTPQGKWLADFFILSDGQRLLLDAERAQAGMLMQRLGRFRLRSKITLSDQSDAWRVHAAWGGEPALPPDAVATPDPRLPEAGWRIFARGPLPVTADAAAWDLHRLALGMPDGSRDLESEKTVLLEAGFDELHGVSWTKGCYMGQELTARTKYRGLVRKRLLPVKVEGPLPAPGTAVLSDGKDVGEIRSGSGDRAIAMLRLEALGKGDFTADQAKIVPQVPSWMRLEEETT